MKHEYCAHIINAKKVVCICGKIIKLNRCWEEDYLNRHAKNSGCKAKEGQRSIYNFYKPVTQPKNAESSEEEFDSDVYDNMDEDDLLQVDEIDNDDDDISTPPLITNNNKNAYINQKSVKYAADFSQNKYLYILNVLQHNLEVLDVLRL